MNQESKRDVKERIRQRYKGGDTENMYMIPARPKETIFDECEEKKVCAYCRVSTDDPRQTSSYELQKNHYEEVIKDHPGWVLVDIYADDGSASFKLERHKEFNRMLSDCQQGKIDLIICNNIVCFSRNIMECVQTVKMLLDLKPPVGVFFEEERMITLDSTREMTL